MFEEEKSFEEEERAMDMLLEAAEGRRATGVERGPSMSRVESVNQLEIKLERSKLKINQEPNKQRQIINQLLSAAEQTDPTKKLLFYNYPVVFELAISLFSERNYITSSNAVFYMGLLFNFLRIIEVRMDPVRDQENIRRLC